MNESTFILNSNYMLRCFLSLQFHFILYLPLCPFLLWLLHFFLALGISTKRHFKQCGLPGCCGKDGIDPGHPGELWQMEKTDEGCGNICHALLISACCTWAPGLPCKTTGKTETRGCRGSLKEEYGTPGWLVNDKFYDGNKVAWL